jgi:hypothetical protein
MLPLMPCLPVSVHSVYLTGLNSGRGLRNVVSHSGNYVRMYVLHTRVVFVWISYDL